MNQETLEVPGTVQPDGSLVLDEKLNLPASRVHVTVQTRKEPKKVVPVPGHDGAHMGGPKCAWPCSAQQGGDRRGD